MKIWKGRFGPNLGLLEWRLKLCQPVILLQLAFPGCHPGVLLFGNLPPLWHLQNDELVQTQRRGGRVVLPSLAHVMHVTAPELTFHV